jgi:hypothetical protein
MRELVDIDTRPARGRNPAPMRHVGDGGVVANQVAGFGAGEVLVQNAVEASRFVGVALYAVFNALGCVAVKVVCLALVFVSTLQTFCSD